MNASRQDLTKWALHFIHDYNPDYTPADQMIEDETHFGFPYHENREIDDRFDDWRIKDEEHFHSGYEPSAFEVLLKIIDDGHIRSTWAFRRNRPTVYGPRAATCFTEMPLYALVDYAKVRQTDAVGLYAIGVLKKELFQAGGRPVIYGLSGKHVVSSRQSTDRGWPRKLAPSCGIAETEQYRYVAMSQDPQRPIDWSHEREWRWVDHKDQCSCPGLPIWLSNEPISFSAVLIVVPKSTEINRVLNLLKELHDAGQNDYFHPFQRTTLNATRVVALDQLRTDTADVEAKNLRLEDIPTSRLQDFKQPKASPELVEQVRAVLVEARKAADDAASEFLKTAPRTPDGRHIADVAGWAELVVYDSQSPVVSALQKLDKESGDRIHTIAGIGYLVPGVGGLGWKEEQALSIAEEAVHAAKSVFEKHFPDVSFGIWIRRD